jgi:hypothetical protein
VGGELPVESNTYLSYVAINGQGDFIIAASLWGGGYSIHRYSANGQPLGNWSTNSPYPHVSDVALADNGEYVIALNVFTGNYSGYLAHFSSTDAPLGNGISIDDVFFRNYPQPAVAFGSDGRLAVTWVSSSYSANNQTMARLYREIPHPASVGGRVWNDRNLNGVQDAGEIGMRDVIVNLYKGASLFASRYTSYEGQYRFDDLVPGDSYSLEFVVPDGYFATEMDRGTDDAADSDADPITGRTAPFSLSDDEINLHQDLGIIKDECVISGVKFNDRDRDGLRDPGEEGLAGWIIFLDTNRNGKLDENETSTSTDNLGAYALSGLTPGSYNVAEVPQVHWRSIAPPAGSQTVTLVRGQILGDVDFAGHTRVRDSTATAAGDVFVVSSVASQQISPAVASDADGDYVIAWQAVGDGGAGWDIFARRYDSSGRPRGNTFRVNTTTAGDQVTPALASDRRGNFVITWASESIGGSGWDIYALRYDRNGRVRGGEFRVNSTIALNQTNPAIAMDRIGDFTIVWRSASDFYWGGDVYAQCFNAAGQRRGGEFRVNADSDRNQTDPSIAFDADGDFIVAWAASYGYGDPGEVLARRYNANASPRGEEFRVGSGGSPAVAMDARGDFVVASTFYSTVHVQRYSRAGIAQGSAVTVSTDGRLQYPPSVAMDNDGDFAVAWSGFFYGSGGYGGNWASTAGAHEEGPTDGYSPGGGYRPSPVTTTARRYNAAGVAQGDAFTLASGTGFTCSIAMDNDGDLVVAWEGSVGTVPSIYAQRYHTDPALRAAPTVRALNEHDDHVTDIEHVWDDVATLKTAKRREVAFEGVSVTVICEAPGS